MQYSLINKKDSIFDCINVMVRPCEPGMHKVRKTLHSFARNLIFFRYAKHAKHRAKCEHIKY